MVWRGGRLVAVLALAALPLAPGEAGAFQVKTSATTGCHEAITARAMLQVGWPDGAEPPEPDDTEGRALDDVPFDFPDSARDPWTLALLIGARYNDLRAASPYDFAALSQLHDNPQLQPEHCIRKREHDGQEGDALALAACRDFILGELELALGDGEAIDMDARETVETRLVFRGRVDIDLVSYAFHLGRAVHALQDSYTHAFRGDGDGRVRHVLNWIEGNTGDSYDEARDGHPHLAVMDECGDYGAGAQRRDDWATDASVELMAALADPEGGRAGRLERAAAVIDLHFERQDGCTFDNDYCDTPEATATPPGCSAGGADAGVAGLLVVLVLLIPVTVASRRRRLATALVLAVALSGGRGRALAQEAPAAPPTADEKAETKIEKSLDREEKVIDRLPDQVTQRFGAALNVGAAFDRAAAAVSAGFRWNPWDSVGFGLDLEYNPWFSITSAQAAPGAASLYVPIIWKLKRFGTWELRSTFYAGASMLLFDLVGADKGTIGAFVGWNPLGLALPLGTHTKFIVKPGDIAVSAPQLTGIPFVYHQYRFTVGLEWYP